MSLREENGQAELVSPSLPTIMPEDSFIPNEEIDIASGSFPVLNYFLTKIITEPSR